ncbi:aspartate aminotransferase family protein [Lachnospiraceae bacterium 66-29]
MEATVLMEQAEKNILHTYNRFPIVLDHGQGVYLYDTDGKKYLDFTAGIAVQALGYGDQEYNEALKAQIDKLLHTSNLYYNQPIIDAAAKLCAASGLDYAFFTNSGAEAVEGAIKTAKKYAYLKDGCTDHEIIAMNQSFHGRTLGALSVTGNAHYREPFEPLPGIVKFADYNDLGSVKALITEKTCAIIMETVQGEGGIYPAEEGFLRAVKEICVQNDILLILDEIQCGMGRTGEMFAWQAYDVKPDLMVTAKALGCGVPVGAFVMTKKVAKASLKPGDHGTTYGGNPFVGAAVSKVFDIFAQRNLTAHVKEIGGYLEAQLEQLKSEYDCIADRRGVGLIQGLQLNIPVGDVAAKALQQGLLVITAGTNVLRFVPPLVIEKEHVDEMMEKIKVVLSSVTEH